MRVLMALIILIALSGCANFNSIYRPLDTSSGQGALIDIKQRAIIAGKRVGSTGSNEQLVVCAEPSPDAMASYAAEVAAKSEKAGVELATAFQEGAAFTGVRTASIQLLRDQLFDNCIGFMNGALTPSQYELRARRYQRHMVAYLAIEQLTGAIRPPAVALLGASSASNSKNLNAIAQEIGLAEDELAKLNATSEDGMNQQEKDTLARKKKLWMSIKDDLEASLKGAKASLASGGVTATFQSEGAQGKQTESNVETVTSAVKKIASDILLADDSPQVCLILMQTEKFDNEDLRGFCTDALAATNKLKFARAKLVESIANRIKMAKTTNEALKLIKESNLEPNPDENLLGVHSSIKLDIPKPEDD